MVKGFELSQNNLEESGEYIWITGDGRKFKAHEITDTHLKNIINLFHRLHKSIPPAIVNLYIERFGSAPISPIEQSREDKKRRNKSLDASSKRKDKEIERLKEIIDDQEKRIDRLEKITKSFEKWLGV